MIVSDYMSQHLVTISAQASVQGALELLQEHHLRHLPVVEGSGRLLGVLAERDLLLATSRHLHAAMEVAEAMSDDVVTVTPETDLAEAAALMTTHAVGCLPVVDRQRRLVGILTESDLYRALIRLLSGEREIGG